MTLMVTINMQNIFLKLTRKEALKKIGKKYLVKVFTLDNLTAELQDTNTELYFARLGNKAIGFRK